MNGFLIRFSLFLKLWFTSIYSILIMLAIPVVAIILYNNSGSNTIEDISSVIYEKAAPIWLVFITQWCFSIEFDSKFYQQLITYPASRWKFLIERCAISLLIFAGLLSLVTVILTPLLGHLLWNGFAFTLPVYIAISGFMIAGTLLGNHSIGGMFAGIFFWMMALFGGALLKDLNVILLIYGSVYSFVNGQTGFFSIENHWILYNRLFYLGVGVLLIIGSMIKFSRKPI